MFLVLRTLPVVLILAGAMSCTRPQPPHATAPSQPPRIANFYASPARIGKGEPALLCYGVENADAVRLDPGARALTPSFTRCVDAEAATTTTFTLTASKSGQPSATATATLTVGAPKAKIGEINITTLQIRQGEQANLCYKVSNAVRVEVRPLAAKVWPRGSACTAIAPAVTTKYTVIAHGADGDTDSEEVTLKVIPRRP